MHKLSFAGGCKSGTLWERGWVWWGVGVSVVFNEIIEIGEEGEGRRI